jgi:hypothetical protein
VRPSRARDVALVELAHCGEVLERADLVRQLLALADHLIVRPHVVDLRAFRLLGFEQTIDAIERDAAVIADDPPASICIG